jgi:hypothetical protein
MAKFITRVELYNAKKEDYEILNKELERTGFSRTITGSNGIVYQLPAAEYWIEGKLLLTNVLIIVQNAAKLVTGATWEGLLAVK